MDFKDRWQMTKVFIKTEAPVLVISLAVYGGVRSFLAMGEPYWAQKAGDTQLLAMAITIIAIQKVWRKVGPMKSPWSVKLSVAFREGFFMATEILAMMSRSFTKTRGYLKNMTKKL